jgi:hypothetical protein
MLQQHRADVKVVVVHRGCYAGDAGHDSRWSAIERALGRSGFLQAFTRELAASSIVNHQSSLVRARVGSLSCPWRTSPPAEKNIFLKILYSPTSSAAIGVHCQCCHCCPTTLCCRTAINRLQNRAAISNRFVVVCGRLQSQPFSTASQDTTTARLSRTSSP